MVATEDRRDLTMWAKGKLSKAVGRLLYTLENWVHVPRRNAREKSVCDLRLVAGTDRTELSAEGLTIRSIATQVKWMELDL